MSLVIYISRLKKLDLNLIHCKRVLSVPVLLIFLDVVLNCAHEFLSLDKAFYLDYKNPL